MGCAISMVKYLLFLFNLVFSLCGLALLILGILIQTETSTYDDFLDGKFSAPPILLIVVGSIVFVVAFYGCCGAIRESHCMIVTFAVLLLTIFILQVVAASVAFVFSNDTEDIFEENLANAVKAYKTDETQRKTMDALQEALKCCGEKGPDDYKTVMADLPASCCINSDGKECANSGNEKMHYTQGCTEALKTFIHDAGIVLGGVAIGVAGVELVGVIFALCLANSIKNKERRGR